MILVLDNYDSFVHNLSRYLRRLGQQTHVVRNDAIDVEDVLELDPAAIVISPGPCTPAEAGCSEEFVKRFSGEIPILGVCLGHQAIATSFGGQVVRSARPVHGQSSPVVHAGVGLFEDLPSPMEAGRYHSLIVDAKSLPGCLTPTAWTDNGVLMAFEHREHATYGVQFHPESILTPDGRGLLTNFLQRAGIECRADRGELELLPAAEVEPPRTLPLTPVAF